MNDRKFDAEVLRDVVWEDSNDYTVVSDVIISNSSWSEHHEMVFKEKATGKHYHCKYSQGLTESQDEEPFQDEDEVLCIEVHQVDKVVKAWEPTDG